MYYFKVKCPACENTTDFGDKRKPDAFHMLVKLIECVSCKSKMKLLVLKNKKENIKGVVIVHVATITLTQEAIDAIESRKRRIVIP